MNKSKLKSHISIASIGSEVMVLEQQNSHPILLSRLPTQTPTHDNSILAIQSDNHDDEDLGREEHIITHTSQILNGNGSGDNLNSSHVTRQESLLNCTVNPAYNKMKMVRNRERWEVGLEHSQHQQKAATYDYPRMVAPQFHGCVIGIPRPSHSEEVEDMTDTDADGYMITS